MTPQTLYSSLPVWVTHSLYADFSTISSESPTQLKSWKFLLNSDCFLSEGYSTVILTCSISIAYGNSIETCTRQSLYEIALAWVLI